MGKKIWPTEVEGEVATQTLSKQAEARDLGVRQGDVLRDNQVRHEAFDKVNKEWLLKCPTFESVIKEVENFEKTCDDLEDVKLSDLKIVNAKVVVSDLGVYALSDTAISQLAAWSNVPVSYLHLLRGVDTNLFDLNATKGLQRAVKEGNDRETFLRTRTFENGGIMRAMLSDRYSTIDNLPILKILAEVVPGGRLSHMRYSGDTFRSNILIPDVCREENDSDYGGGISVLNNETGGGAYRQRPFVFRHICCNGNVWDRKDGFRYAKVHKGEIVWNTLKASIVDNLNRQIPIVNDLITKVLSLKTVTLTESEIKKAVVFITDRELLSRKVAQSWYEGFKVEANTSMTGSMFSAFGVVQGLTRAAQDQTLELQELMESLSGRLISSNWDNLAASAQTVDDKRVDKVLVEANR